MILSRLKEGRIEEKYKLGLKKYEIENVERQLALLEEQKEYLTNKRKKK